MYFKVLEVHNANYLAFDPCYQCITSDQYIKSKVQEIKDMYVDAGEEIPPNVPKPRGKPVRVKCFVDYDHVVDRPIQKYQTGISSYFNSAPIIYYPNRENNVEIPYVWLRICSIVINYIFNCFIEIKVDNDWGND